MINNLFIIRDALYLSIKNKIAKDIPYEVDVLQSRIDLMNKPLVVFREIRNRPTNRKTNGRSYDRALTYDIDIYTQGKDFAKQGDEIASAITELLEVELRLLDGGIQNVIPRFNGQPNTQQINMKYNTTYNTCYSHLY